MRLEHKHKYVKPKMPFPLLERLVSWVQHLFTSNGICLLISLLLPPAHDTGPEEENSCPAQQFEGKESLLGTVWEIVRGRLLCSMEFGQTVYLLQVGGLNGLQTV